MSKKQYRIMAVAAFILAMTFLGSATWLWYDSHVDRSGWVEKDGVRYYRDFHAQPVSGWLDVDGQRYFFLEGGIPHTGWLRESASAPSDAGPTVSLAAGGETTYYFGSNGVMQTGWQEIEGSRYYFDGSGIMQTGFADIDGSTYYFQEDGANVTGFADIGENRYYFDDSGVMAAGFTQIEDSTYYFQEDGPMVTGAATIQEEQYLFSDQGVMHTGWLDTEEGRRYYRADGPMVLDCWQEIEEKLYFFDEEGLMQTGWHQEGEYMYYLQDDGSAAIGPVEIDGETHYFTPQGIEVILVNRDHPVPSYYELDLVTVVDWHQVDRRCYDALMQMLSDCSEAGIEYIFNSGYRTKKQQTLILETRTQEHMEDFDLSYDEAYEKALETVAIPGTSEHHLGLAVDLLGDEAIPWLTEHCWEYGFIVRYTEEKEAITGIIDEPWHFRYVGPAVSLDMQFSGLCLEEYLGAA